MQEEDKLIIEYRKRQLQSLEELPLRENDWKKLEAVLPTSPRSRVSFYRWMSVAGLLLLLVVSSVYYRYTNKPEQVKAGLELVNPVLNENNKAPVATIDQVNASVASTDKIYSVTEKSTSIKSHAVKESVLLTSGRIEEFYLRPVEELLLKNHGQLLNRKKKMSSMPVFAPYDKYPVVTKAIKKSWSVNLFAGNGMNKYSYSAKGLMMFNMPSSRLQANNSQLIIDNAPGHGSLEDYKNELASNASNFQSKGEYSAFEQVAISNYGVPTQTKIKHKFPVSAGLSVKKQLTDKLALESGLVYTLLSSDLYAGEEAHYTQEQRLHYLGIPLKINYSFWKRDRLSCYISGGGMVEFCLDGSLRSNYFPINDENLNSRTELDINKPQFSVMSSIGMQFDIVRPLSLYAEPGFSYYFDDKSEVETIRKEHRFNISLQFGLRISF